MEDPFKNYGLLDTLADTAKGFKYIPEAWDHISFPEQFKRELEQQYPDIGKRYDRSILDMAINYGGGYDWGNRETVDPQDAADMGKAYQYSQSIFDQLRLKPREEDARQDYIENLAGVKAGIADRGNRATMDDLLKMAYEYAVSKAEK